MATGQPVDPYLNFNFLVEIQGITRAAFQEASGFDSAIDVTEYREGGANTTPYKLPGQTKYSNITLKRGITADTELFDWHQQFVTGDPAATRQNGSIVVLDRSGAEVRRWNFVRGWPSKWTGPSFNAGGKEVAIETLEIAHEGIAKG